MRLGEQYFPRRTKDERKGKGRKSRSVNRRGKCSPFAAIFPISQLFSWLTNRRFPRWNEQLFAGKLPNDSSRKIISKPSRTHYWKCNLNVRIARKYRKSTSSWSTDLLKNFTGRTWANIWRKCCSKVSRLRKLPQLFASTICLLIWCSSISFNRVATSWNSKVHS